MAPVTLRNVPIHFPENIPNSRPGSGSLKLIERMNKLPPEHAHAPDEARVKRWEDAKLHPNDRDFEKIRAWAKKVTE